MGATKMTQSQQDTNYEEIMQFMAGIYSRLNRVVAVRDLTMEENLIIEKSAQFLSMERNNQVIQ
jgi:hypothetical protein